MFVIKNIGKTPSLVPTARTLDLREYEGGQVKIQELDFALVDPVTSRVVNLTSLYADPNRPETAFWLQPQASMVVKTSTGARLNPRMRAQIGPAEVTYDLRPGKHTFYSHASGSADAPLKFE